MRLFAAISQSFRQRFSSARAAYKKFRLAPTHPSLQFKQLHASLQLWSVRVTKSYRAVAVRNDDDLIWFFIGTHAEYDRLLASL